MAARPFFGILDRQAVSYDKHKAPWAGISTSILRDPEVIELNSTAPGRSAWAVFTLLIAASRDQNNKGVFSSVLEASRLISISQNVLRTSCNKIAANCAKFSSQPWISIESVEGKSVGALTVHKFLKHHTDRGWGGDRRSLRWRSEQPIKMKSSSYRLGGVYNNTNTNTSSPGLGESEGEGGGEIWSGLAKCFGLTDTTSVKQRHSAEVEALRDLKATAAEIEARFYNYPRHFVGMVRTPAALVRHWDLLAQEPPHVEKTDPTRIEAQADKYSRWDDGAGAAGRADPSWP